MTRKARKIRQYQVAYGMTKREADAYYNFRQETERPATIEAKLYYSTTLKTRVTVPDSER